MDMKKIGEFLKFLRKERGLTQSRPEDFYGSGTDDLPLGNGVNMPDLSAFSNYRRKWYNLLRKNFC